MVMSGLAFSSPMGCMLGGLVATIGGIFGMNGIAPEYYNQVIKG